MEVQTTRFGSIEVDSEDLIRFPAGLPGLQCCQLWVLLADVENEALGWLQSVAYPEIALAVVSPQRFVADYDLSLARSELESLKLPSLSDAQVFVVLNHSNQGMTLNLKAPLVINPALQLGRQVVSNGDWPLRHLLTTPPNLLRKSA